MGYLLGGKYEFCIYIFLYYLIGYNEYVLIFVIKYNFIKVVLII